MRTAGLADRSTFIAVLLIACAAHAYAQPPSGAIAGLVVDARTMQPLGGVLVELATPHLVTTTDSDGGFRLEGIPPGRYELLISFVGYAFTRRDVEVAAGENRITIPLAEGTTAYDESVIVRGDLFGARESGVAAQQSLGSAELRQLGGMTLDDPLRAVQSLAGVTAADDLYSELIVRGHGAQSRERATRGARDQHAHRPGLRSARRDVSHRPVRRDDRRVLACRSGPAGDRFRRRRTRHDPRERRDIDVPSAHHAPDLLPCQLRAVLLRRRERRRAGPFRQVVREAKRRAHAFLERRLVERDDVVQLLLEDAERQIERDARRHPFGERIDALRRHALRAPP